MRYLVVAPQLGFQPDGSISPGGLLQFGRCVVRALSSSPQISKLGIYCQLDNVLVENDIRRMVDVYAHSGLKLDIRGFSGARGRMSLEIIKKCISKSYDRVMYLLVNQSVLGLTPGHLKYDVWEIGEELYHPVSLLKGFALRNADRLFSISHTTAFHAEKYNKGLQHSQVVYLCVEPPLYTTSDDQDQVNNYLYIPSQRQDSVLIVANLHASLLYKGHQQLIDAWPEVVNKHPNSMLWIAGDGDGKLILQKKVSSLPDPIRKHIIFWGYVSEAKLQELYTSCRIFAMPSIREGFGLVFVEAAKYGLPCIGGKYDAVKEIIQNGETGFLVEQDPHDIASVCNKLLSDDVLAKRLGDANKNQYFEKYQFKQFRVRLLNSLGLTT